MNKTWLQQQGNSPGAPKALYPGTNVSAVENGWNMSIKQMAGDFLDAHVIHVAETQGINNKQRAFARTVMLELVETRPLIQMGVDGVSFVGH